MKLTSYQKKAFEDFKKFGYLVVEAPRRSGKTTLLKAIIECYPNKYRIGICCQNYRMYKAIPEYADFDYIAPENLMEAIITKKYGLIIGDEVLIEPQEGVKTACALTPRYYIHRWYIDDVPFLKKKELKKFKESMSEENYRTEIGN